MTEIEVNGVNFRIGRLDAFTQFHIARRLAPIQLAMGVSAAELAQKATADESTIAAAIMGPIADIMSKMPQDDVDYILKSSLAVVSRKQGESWARVLVNGGLMFDDIRMKEMVRLTIAVIKENMDGFFGGLPDVTP